jgi:diaminopimelate epimerase
MLKFTKMNGAGNDFVVLDNRDESLALATDQISFLCDRHRGVGADGLLVVEPAANGADFRMRYYNADGGEADMCANGARCFARYTSRLVGQPESVSFETPAGVIRAECIGDNIRLAMSQPHSLALDRTVQLPAGPLTVHSINTGVPHAVVFVDDAEKVDVRGLGAGLRYHNDFAPKGTNANFVQPIDASTAIIRTYERGVEDETLACGTGVVASALIMHQKLGATSPIQLRVRGGDTLTVTFDFANGEYSNVTITGPADFVFEGQIGI